MTEAVTVRRDGDTYQARIFWARAARLLVPESHVVKVAFETGPKSFDDVWVDYAAGAGLLDQYGRPLLREHIQCKWHVSPDQYGYAELVDPAFINANARSLLQRAHEAQKNAGGAGIRFKLLTNWVVTRKDPLQRLIGEKSGALRHKRLFDEGGERSGVGQLRKLWRDHLALDDDGLRLLADSLAFGRTSDSLDGLRDYLDLIFLAAGIRRFSLSESVFPYDDLIFQWMSQGRQEFDRALLFDGLKRERLLANSVPPTMCYGVKSFEHAFDALHLRCSEVLDLTPEFDERFIIEQDDWSQVIYPRLLGFLRRAASASQQRLRLSLDAHSTLAFAAGSIFDVKSGRMIELEQRSPHRQIWASDDQEFDIAWPTLEATLIEFDSDQSEIAVAVGMTHAIGEAVADYVRTSLPAVGKLLVFEPTGGPAFDSVICGRHASMFAQQIAAETRKVGGGKDVHMFIASPNALAFFLGQRRILMGPTILYEYDFENARSGSYIRSLSLPMVKL